MDPIERKFLELLLDNDYSQETIDRMQQMSRELKMDFIERDQIAETQTPDPTHFFDIIRKNLTAENVRALKTVLKTAKMSWIRLFLTYDGLKFLFQKLAEFSQECMINKLAAKRYLILQELIQCIRILANIRFCRSEFINHPEFLAPMFSVIYPQEVVLTTDILAVTCVFIPASNFYRFVLDNIEAQTRGRLRGWEIMAEYLSNVLLIHQNKSFKQDEADAIQADAIRVFFAFLGAVMKSTTDYHQYAGLILNLHKSQVLTQLSYIKEHQQDVQNIIEEARNIEQLFPHHHLNPFDVRQVCDFVNDNMSEQRRMSINMHLANLIQTSPDIAERVFQYIEDFLFYYRQLIALKKPEKIDEAAYYGLHAKELPEVTLPTILSEIYERYGFLGNQILTELPMPTIAYDENLEDSPEALKIRVTGLHEELKIVREHLRNIINEEHAASSDRDQLLEENEMLKRQIPENGMDIAQMKDIINQKNREIERLKKGIGVDNSEVSRYNSLFSLSPSTSRNDANMPMTLPSLSGLSGFPLPNLSGIATPPPQFEFSLIGTPTKWEIPGLQPPQFEYPTEVQTPPPPPPPPPPPGFIPPPPGGIKEQGKKNVPPPVKLRSFFWTKLNKQQAKGTLWEDMEDIEVDTTRLEDNFKARIMTVKKLQKFLEKKKECEKIVELLESNRSRSVNIMLSRFKIRNDDIATAIMQLRFAGVFTEDQFAALYACRPKPEEMAQILAYTGDRTLLGTAEKYFLALSGINDFDEHLSFMNISYNFEDMMKNIDNPLDILIRSLTAIKESQSLRKMLQVILAFGNYMNGGTIRGGAYGFKIKSLSDLIDFRGATPGINFMHILVWTALDKEGFQDLQQFSDDLKDIPTATKIDLDTIRINIRELKTQMEKFKAIKEASKDRVVDGDLFYPKFCDFEPKATPRLNAAEVELIKVEGLFTECLQLFGENPVDYNLTTFLEVFAKFVTQFDDVRNAEIQAREKAAAEAEQKKKEEEEQKLIAEKTQVTQTRTQQRGILDDDLVILGNISKPQEEAMRTSKARSTRIAKLLSSYT